MSLKLFAKIGDTGKNLCYHISSYNKNKGILKEHIVPQV